MNQPVPPNICLGTPIISKTGSFFGNPKTIFFKTFFWEKNIPSGGSGSFRKSECLWKFLKIVGFWDFLYFFFQKGDHSSSKLEKLLNLNFLEVFRTHNPWLGCIFLPMAPPRLPIALDLPPFVSPSFQKKTPFLKNSCFFIRKPKNASSDYKPPVAFQWVPIVWPRIAHKWGLLIHGCRKNNPIYPCFQFKGSLINGRRVETLQRLLTNGVLLVVRGCL